MSIFAFNIILVTILLCYAIIGTVSEPRVSDFLGEDMVGIGGRTFTFNLSPVILLIGVSLLITAIERLPVWVYMMSKMQNGTAESGLAAQ